MSRDADVFKSRPGLGETGCEPACHENNNQPGSMHKYKNATGLRQIVVSYLVYQYSVSIHLEWQLQQYLFQLQ